MVDYRSAKQEYLQLGNIDKKTRLMTLFEIFQVHSVAIQKMMPILLADQMREDEMVQAYDNLVDAIQSVEGEKLQTALLQMDSLGAKMEALRQQEAIDRAQENPDALLQQI
jgi:hypothetical protein